jgi:cell division protein FtsI/penicillin-binding protein 2
MRRPGSTTRSLAETELSRLRTNAQWLRIISLSLLLYATGGLIFVFTHYPERIGQIACFQTQRGGVIPTSRGRILDCKNRPLVDNRIIPTMFVNPSLVKDDERENLANALSQYFGYDIDKAREILSNVNSTWRVLINDMTEDDLANFDALPKSGPIAELMREVGMTNREVRYYPLGPMAGPVLGFTAWREYGQVGLWGIEEQFDDVLAGRAGQYSDIRDQSGRRIPSTRKEVISPRYGTDLVLTIDSDVQALAESALSAGITETGAIGGAIVVTDPSTGNVLALAGEPALDPSNYVDYLEDENALFSRPTCLCYEPGSVMKIFTTAAGFEEGVVNQNSYLHVTTGQLRFHGGYVPDHDYPPINDMSIRDVIVHSCNRGAALMAVSLRRDRLSGWLHRFGFGSRTGLNLPGEPSGDLKDQLSPFPEIDLADMGFGQGITASPLQLAQAVGVFANDGNMVPLRLVQARRDPACAEQYPFDPSPSIRVINPSTAAILQDFMIEVIEEGTATPARSAWTCAGKTGTAQKINPAGGYFRNRFFSTFAGYGPIPNPKWVIVIILDEPRYPYFGGTSCGPVFHRLFTNLMIREGIPPERNPNEPLPSQLALNAAGPNATKSGGASKAKTAPEVGEYVLTPDPFGSEREPG